MARSLRACTALCGPLFLSLLQVWADWFREVVLDVRSREGARWECEQGHHPPHGAKHTCEQPPAYLHVNRASPLAVPMPRWATQGSQACTAGGAACELRTEHRGRPQEVPSRVWHCHGGYRVLFLPDLQRTGVWGGHAWGRVRGTCMLLVP